MEQPKYKAFSKGLLRKLRIALPTLEWDSGMIDIKGKNTLIIEAYNPETDMGIGISLGQKPTTQDKEKLLNTILSQAETLVKEDLVLEVIREEMRRGQERS